MMRKYIPSTVASRSARSEEHTSELQSRLHLVCRLLLEKKKIHISRVREADNDMIHPHLRDGTIEIAQASHDRSEVHRQGCGRALVEYTNVAITRLCHGT